jgi:hypothetical protein
MHVLSNIDFLNSKKIKYDFSSTLNELLIKWILEIKLIYIFLAKFNRVHLFSTNE